MGEYGPPDDVDRLFACLEAPPLAPDFLAATLARAAARHRRRAVTAMSGYAGLLAAIAVIAFGFGRGLAVSGANSVLALAVLAPAAVSAAPRDFLWALVENVPWGWLAALVVAAVALARCASAVGSLLARPRAARRQLEARHG